MSGLPSCVDIVIIGAGPVGLLLAVCMTRWGYKVKLVDNRAQPTITGRADGIQPRSLEILRNMGLKRALMAHTPARSNKVAFWDPLPAGKGIHRTGSSDGCPHFIDARYPFTTLLHQGHIERVFIDDLAKHGAHVQRPWTIKSFRKNDQDLEYPVEVNLKELVSDQEETVQAKYLFGGEGARSFVREQLGIRVQHKDRVSYVWGVMDGVVRTDFPDIKLKSTIHSDNGSIMVIPRENNMVRLYVQLASSTDEDWDPKKRATEAEVQATAKRILKPYYIEWDSVVWYSVYPIRQGLAEKYTLDHRVFIGGDSCHTHSPKAGQGMNTAFHDALNLAWKIHHVEGGFAKSSLLSTYESERRQLAEQLLDFDADFARLFSQRQPSANELSAASNYPDHEDGNAFVKMFKASTEFTTGYGIAYGANELNWTVNHPAQSDLFDQTASKLRSGRVMPTANVTRVVNANPAKLEQEIPLNGSFRIFLFAGAPAKTKRAVSDFAAYLENKNSFYSIFQRRDIENVSYHERHNPHSRFFTICLIFAALRDQIDVAGSLPAVLARYSDHIYADDVKDERVPGAKASAHAKMGLDEERGGVLVVRPDGHVGCVVGLREGSGTVNALNAYFGAFTSRPLGKVGQEAHL